MVQAPQTNDARQPRVDVERNRASLLEAAKRRFADEGASASLKQIALDAAVGIGTLYRHFPTRDELIEAVYRQEVDTLVAAAARLEENATPIEALRAWLILFIDFVETKNGMEPVLNQLIGGSEPLYKGTPARLAPPIGRLVERANNGGSVSITIAPLDLLRAIVGVATIRPDAEWKQQAVALVDLLLRGARSKG